MEINKMRNNMKLSQLGLEALIKTIQKGVIESRNIPELLEQLEFQLDDEGDLIIMNPPAVINLNLEEDAKV